ncbi:MAG TPA: hypothetical protein VGK48_11990 [Terriglobia bacterium]|jgi:hypothetical protein
MKTAALFAIALVILPGVSGLSQRRKQAPRIEDSVVTFYVSEFQRVVNVNPDVFAKILPIIQEFIQTRFDISARRQETLQQLRMLVNRPKSSDEDIKRTIRDLAKADTDIEANQERFLSNIDPLLTPRQQGRVRIFQQVADQRMRQMLNSVRKAPSVNQ